MSLVIGSNVKLLSNGSHSPKSISLVACQHILGRYCHGNIYTLSCVKRGALPPHPSRMLAFLRCFAQTAICKARSVHESRGRLSRSHAHELSYHVGCLPRSAQRRHLRIISTVTARHRNIQRIHTDLERSESESVTLPFAIDQAFLRVPYNLSVLQRCSGCRAVHIFRFYRPAAFHAFVDGGSDLQVTRGFEVESWQNFHYDGKALTRARFDVGVLALRCPGDVFLLGLYSL